MCHYIKCFCEEINLCMAFEHTVIMFIFILIITSRVDNIVTTMGRGRPENVACLDIRFLI